MEEYSWNAAVPGKTLIKNGSKRSKCHKGTLLVA